MKGLKSFSSCQWCIKEMSACLFTISKWNLLPNVSFILLGLATFMHLFFNFYMNINHLFHNKWLWYHLTLAYFVLSFSFFFSFFYFFFSNGKVPSKAASMPWLFPAIHADFSGHTLRKPHSYRIFMIAALLFQGITL